MWGGDIIARKGRDNTLRPERNVNRKKSQRKDFNPNLLINKYSVFVSVWDPYILQVLGFEDTYFHGSFFKDHLEISLHPALPLLQLSPKAPELV